MRGFERDEYEDWDEYEEDGEEQEGEEGADDGYEETQQPTQEQLEYLELRQRLKESIRKQMKKEQGSASAGSRDKTNAYRKDNYGSFFGPSQPVIAQRVIQESRSLLENPDLAARISKANHTNNRSSVSAPVRSKSQANHRPSVTNGLKKKVEMLKNTRDYSFLLSEDAEVPASSKSPPPRHVLAPKTDARSAQLQPKSKQVVNDRGREVLNGRGREVLNGRGREVLNGHDGRKPMLASSQSKPKVGIDRMAPAGKSPAEYRKQLGSNSGSGPGRPLGPKGVPSKSPAAPAAGKATPSVAKNTMDRVHKPIPSPMQSVARRPASSNLPSGVNRPIPSRGQPLLLKKPSVQKEYQETGKPKVMTKQALPYSREQFKRPPSKPPARGTLADERPKAKPKRQLYDEDSEVEDAFNILRGITRYNPNKYQDEDDDSDMEANYDDIMREEQRSARIARKEDEEQLRLIEEEERRERLRLAKKRKLGH